MAVLDKGIPTKFLSSLLFVVFLACREYVYAAETSTRCIESEREALLRFKQSLTDDHGLLSSWGTEDECCEWDRVICSSTTGHVTALHLYAAWSSGYLHGFGGKISSAVLELHHLSYIDLSSNDFGGIRIPEFVGSIKTLQHLFLSGSNFSGSIPPQIGNLTNLRSLDLSGSRLWSDNLYWLSHLSYLTYLDLSGSTISDPNWLQHVTYLPSLQTLVLEDCMLTDVTKPSAGLFLNSSSLYSLDLSFNELTSVAIFEWLVNISCSYVSVDVSSNLLDGPVPDAVGKLSFLQSLYLYDNMLKGGIPESWGNLSHLQYLELSGNDLGEPIESLLGKLSCKQLVQLDLTDTKLTGSVTAENLAPLSKLKYLQMSYNSLTLDVSPDWIPPFDLEQMHLASCKMGPSFPTWLQTQSKLHSLDISNAGIISEVPKWFWNLSPNLNISHNQISDIVPDLSSVPINTFDVSSNKFSGPLPLFHRDIYIAQLSKNQFSGSLSSICTNSTYLNLMLLDLADNYLEGVLPDCWENMINIKILNLNTNNFSGEIPNSLGSLSKLQTLHLRGSSLSGELPSTLKNLQLMQSLDIGSNKLTGHIPPWFGSENLTDMAYLSLRQNRFYGVIPPEICHLSRIQMLDLSGNNLSGKIPECFHNFTSLVDKSGTTSVTIHISAGFNGYIDYALVQWKGQELEYRNTLGLLKLIDLSSNRLVGSIPKAFSSLRGLISLNLSTNSLTGNMDPDIGKMEMLECLDLSRNQLSGEIPIGLAQLYRLAVLHLSNNDFSGKIPLSTQLQSFNESDFAGNDHLCGRPLKLCPKDGVKPSKEGEDGKDKDEGFFSLSLMEEFGISMGLGFIVGFWGLVGSLVLKKSWRSLYFNFLSGIGDWVYVTTTIFLTKFRRS